MMVPMKPIENPKKVPNSVRATVLNRMNALTFSGSQKRCFRGVQGDPKGPKEVPKGPMVNPEGPKEDPKRPQGGPWGALVSLQQIARFATARFGDQKGFKGHQTISVRRDLENGTVPYTYEMCPERDFEVNPRRILMDRLNDSLCIPTCCDSQLINRDIFLQSFFSEYLSPWQIYIIPSRTAGADR